MDSKIFPYKNGVFMENVRIPETVEATSRKRFHQMKGTFLKI